MKFTNFHFLKIRTGWGSGLLAEPTAATFFVNSWGLVIAVISGIGTGASFGSGRRSGISAGSGFWGRGWGSGFVQSVRGTLEHAPVSRSRSYKDLRSKIESLFEIRIGRIY